MGINCLFYQNIPHPQTGGPLEGDPSTKPTQQEPHFKSGQVSCWWPSWLVFYSSFGSVSLRVNLSVVPESVRVSYLPSTAPALDGRNKWVSLLMNSHFPKNLDEITRNNTVERTRVRKISRRQSGPVVARPLFYPAHRTWFRIIARPEASTSGVTLAIAWLYPSSIPV